MATQGVVSIPKANTAVDTIVRVLHVSATDHHSNHIGHRALSCEVVKGGSLGHGTSVRDNYDLDLVIYSKSK